MNRLTKPSAITVRGTPVNFPRLRDSPDMSIPRCFVVPTNPQSTPFASSKPDAYPAFHADIFRGNGEACNHGHCFDSRALVPCGEKPHLCPDYIYGVALSCFDSYRLHKRLS
ncbi:hypothetical protein BMS3Bbin04_00127 [bacterium BMS3Bbin04]|nr:hypothetical protein BMS3Bbin04_00127 [bacterium BMS3Bbin04]